MSIHTNRREFLKKMGIGLISLPAIIESADSLTGIKNSSLPRIAAGSSPPPYTDYCQLLAQEIQGKKHAFLAGNLTYYIGGKYSSWKKDEDETIGLTHPFFDDQRSRGTGMVQDEKTGYGHDLTGWEFYKETRIAYGTVIIGTNRFQNPVPNKMHWRPDKMICEYLVNGVNIREEKFIALNDVVCTIITSDKPISIEFEGRSFASKRSVKKSATCRHDIDNNAVHILEGGEVTVRPVSGVEVTGKLMYDGMSTILSASRSLQNYSQTVSDGICTYKFTVSCDNAGVKIAWVMHDEYATAISQVKNILAAPDTELSAKTKFMNDALNEQIPYFRCSDQEIVNIYYFLWAIHIMYYTDVGAGWEAYPHTQTAVNNFRGMHRYDAVFQIRLGAWMKDKKSYANGNALLWKALVPYAQNGMLPDNMGTSWHSGIYGPSTIAHVPQAWLIYEHSGDKTFLSEVYDFYKSLFWNGFSGLHWGYAFNAMESLTYMAQELNHPEDIAHWNDLVQMDNIDAWLEARWEIDTPNLFWKGEPKLDWSNHAYLGMNKFPDDWARRMTRSWSVDKEKGFFAQVPISTTALKNWDQIADKFTVTPDTNWYAIHGMYLHHACSDANTLTLAHLKGYNMKWGMPIAPESLDINFNPWGDQYSNFNAGKLLLILEGICGVSYSIPKDELLVSDHLPYDWDYMEVRIPVINEAGGTKNWVLVRTERVAQDNKIAKNISVQSNPMSNLKIQPWLEERTLISAPPGYDPDITEGHISYSYSDTTDITLSLQLTPEITAIQSPEKLASQFELQQNYPNPFNATTTIRYALPHRTLVSIRIFDITGRLVDTIFQGYQSTGHHKVTWHADGLASGEYYYEIKTDKFKQVKKMILIR